jgi:imidazolonepropionase-like amidohydrolase
MRTFLLLTLLATFFACSKQHEQYAVVPDSPNFASVNGLWFDGNTFQNGILYSQKGLLTRIKPTQLDSIIDLQGDYVIPPFGEAHNHNLSYPQFIDSEITKYLCDGVFYAMIQSNSCRFRDEIKDRIHHPQSVDVVYSNGALTVSGGHDIEVMHRVFERGMFPGWKKDELNNDAYFVIDNITNLEEKWPLVLECHPDFIKTLLTYSEEYELRKSDEAYFGRRGLNPELLKQIVARAHASDLRVSTHIETAQDFHNAVVADVDIIAHLPGYQILSTQDKSLFYITEEDARQAAKRGIVVITTTSLNKSFQRNDSTQFEVVRQTFKRNIALLRKFGVRLAIGSDRYGSTSVVEAMNIYGYGDIDNLTLLKYCVEITPKTIFPRRKIGLLLEGYEASFLSLDSNPLNNFESVTRVQMRVKQGYILP